MHAFHQTCKPHWRPHGPSRRHRQACRTSLRCLPKVPLPQPVRLGIKQHYGSIMATTKGNILIQGKTGWHLIMMLPSYGPDPPTSPITGDRAT